MKVCLGVRRDVWGGGSAALHAHRRPSKSSVRFSRPYPRPLDRAVFHSLAMCIVSPPRPMTLMPWLCMTARSKL